MNIWKKKLFFSGILLWLFSSAVMASAESDFNKGIEFFRQGDYAAAVEQFKQAEKQGMSSIALHYNLASSYFKQGDYENSKRYFERVAQSPDMRELAEYNLGLIAVKKGDSKEAKQYFTDLVKKSNDEKIVALAKSKLSDIYMAEEQWRTYISANMGYDDNITATPGDPALGISDTYYNLFALVDTVIAGRRRNGWVADATYYRVDFSDTDIYDEDQFAFGIRREAVLSSWETRFHFDLSRKNFGGEDFQSIAKLDVSGKRALSKTEKIYLNYRYEDITSDNIIYDYLEGWRQRVKLEYRDYAGKNYKQLYYELELNDRSNLVTSTYAYDYSPTRHTIRGKYARTLNEQWQVSGDASYRLSDFPESTSFDRNDDQMRLMLSATYSFDKTLKLKAGWLFVDNASSVDIYDYEKTIMTLGISKLF